MFQQAFGFVRFALVLKHLAPQPADSVSPRARPVVPMLEGFPPLLERVAPGPARPFRNSAEVGTLLGRLVLSLEGLALLRTASHTPRPASSTKNPSPFRSTGCASRSVHPCNDAGPAEPQTRALPRYTP